MFSLSALPADVRDTGVDEQEGNHVDDGERRFSFIGTPGFTERAGG